MSTSPLVEWPLGWWLGSKKRVPDGTKSGNRARNELFFLFDGDCSRCSSPLPGIFPASFLDRYALMFYLVGLGLYDERDITIRGLEVCSDQTDHDRKAR